MMGTNLTTSVAAANDIRDIKPPIEIPDYWWLLWVAVGAIILLVLLIIWWKAWQKRRSQIPSEPVVPAHVRAKQKLQEALALITQPKPFCILVSDTIRGYLEERFTFRAPERTTEEFLHELRSTDLLRGEQKEKLGEFLEQCDLVKFAKYEPGENELKHLHDSALRLVEETEPHMESGNTRVPHVESGVAPDSANKQLPNVDERSFRRDAENGAPEARSPESEIVNRKS